MTDNTIFDSVFKTMLSKTPQLLVPFINEAFGRNYPADTPVVPFSNEHESPRGERVTDSVFRLENKIYHLECQSTPDTSMVVRMIEYDFAIALEEALGAGAPYEMNFPESCVLFLRSAGDGPDKLTMKVNLPGGGSFEYETKVVNAQRFTSDELFEKRLLLLLPYYLMRYEKALAQIAADDKRTTELVAECAELRSSLEAATLADGETLLYDELVELIMRVNDYMLEAHETLRRKVRSVMGGEVLELMHERAERLEREARAEGHEQGLADLASKLRESGVDESLLRSATEAIRKERSVQDAS